MTKRFEPGLRAAASRSSWVRLSAGGGPLLKDQSGPQQNARLSTYREFIRVSGEALRSRAERKLSSRLVGRGDALRSRSRSYLGSSACCTVLLVYLSTK